MERLKFWDFYTIEPFILTKKNVRGHLLENSQEAVSF